MTVVTKDQEVYLDRLVFLDHQEKLVPMDDLDHQDLQEMLDNVVHLV